jgi:hypothetical protein
MSAYEARIDNAVCDAFDHEEAVADFIALTETQLLADSETFAEGLSDALFDPRTCNQIVSLFRNGDLLRAAELMRDHVPTYVAEKAETKADKEFRV